MAAFESFTADDATGAPPKQQPKKEAAPKPSPSKEEKPAEQTPASSPTPTPSKTPSGPCSSHVMLYVLQHLSGLHFGSHSRLYLALCCCGPDMLC